MEVDQQKKDPSEEEFEEYEEVESIMHQEENSAAEEELKRCRFCW